MLHPKEADLKAKKLGSEGEDLALHFLEKKGYRLVERNFRVRGGELDLIVQKNGILIFVEVKTRRAATFGAAVDSITPLKLIRLRRAMIAWMDTRRNNGVKIPNSWQCDLVAIDFIAPNRATVCHLPHIFEPP
jgi:putative endonuclease